MNNFLGLGRYHTIRVDVGHDIVTPALLFNGSSSELVALNADVLLHLLNCHVRDGKTELLF